MIRRDAKKRVRLENGKSYRLPIVLVHHSKYYEYEVIGYGVPKQGMYYISGAEPEIHHAPIDHRSDTKYLICKLGRRMKRGTVPVWEPME